MPRLIGVFALVAVIGAAAFAPQAESQRFPEAHPPIGQQPRRPAGYVPFHYPKTPDTVWRNETPEFLSRAHHAWTNVERVINDGPYRPSRESLGTHPCPEWFLDAKLGMFVDWGPWSVAGWAPQAEKATYPDWYEKRLFDELRDYHAKTWGADIGPDDLIQLLDGERFEADRLVSLAKAAGMRYVVPFLKHHGGYALWNSSFTHRDSVEWGLHRDIAQELSRSLRLVGLRYGAYVSLGEWNYPVIVDGSLRTVTLNGRASDPITPETPFLSGKVPVEDFAHDYLVLSLTELIDATSPDILWFDGEWEADPTVWRSPEIAAYAYNKAAREGREIVINDRFGKETRGKPGWGDVYTSEYHVIQGFEPHPWEENRSLSHSYGYNWEESSDDKYVLSEEGTLDLLLRVVANGGNLLLMVSPDGSGRVPPNQERRLRFLGEWLARNGEAVYATRAVGLRDQPTWGYLTRSKRSDRLYCIVRHWPSDGQLVVPVSAAPIAARVLGTSTTATVSRAPNGLALDLSGIHPSDPHASVIIIETAPGSIAPANF
jgi:alpha-L-fucosidase